MAAGILKLIIIKKKKKNYRIHIPPYSRLDVFYRKVHRLVPTCTDTK